MGTTQHPVLKLQIEMSMIESRINILVSQLETVVSELQTLFDGQFSKRFLGGELAVRVIKISNTSNHAISLYANDFYRPGVRAVAIAHDMIPARQSTDVYEVISNA